LAGRRSRPNGRNGSPQLCVRPGPRHLYMLIFLRKIKKGF
jgi:hypothetical protein